MNNPRTLSGIDSDNIRHLSLPSSTAALLIGGDSGTNGQVLTKNEDTNKLEWDDIERRNIAPNSIDGSRLTTDIAFSTTGNIRLTNGNDDAKLTTDKFEYQHGFVGFGDFTMGNQQGTQDIIKYTETPNSSLVIRNTLNQVVGNFQVDDDSATNRLKIFGANGNLTTTGNLISTQPIANGVFGLNITGNAKIQGKLEADGGIDIGNLDVFGDARMRRLDADTTYWFNYQKGTTTADEDFDITLHKVMSIKDAGTSGNRIDFTTATGEIKTTGKIVSNLVGAVGLSVKGNSQFINDVFVENELFLQTDDTDDTTRKIELDATNGNIHQYESYTDDNNNNEYFSVKNGIVAMRGATLGGTETGSNKLTFTNGGTFETQTTTGGTTTTHFTLNGTDGDIEKVRNIDGFGGVFRNQGDIYAYNTLDNNNPDYFAELKGSSGQFLATSNNGFNSVEVNRSIKCGQNGGFGKVLLGFETDGDLLLKESSSSGGSHIRTDNKLIIHGMFEIIPSAASDNTYPILLIQTETDAANSLIPFVSVECDFRINHTATDGGITKKVNINVEEEEAISTFYDTFNVNHIVGSTDTNFFNVDTANSRAYINNTLFIQNDLKIGNTGYTGNTYIQALTSDYNNGGVIESQRLLQGFGENTDGNQLPTWGIIGNDLNNRDTTPEGKSFMSLDRILVNGNPNIDGNGEEDKYSTIHGGITIQPIKGDGTSSGGDPNTGMEFKTQTNDATFGETRISIKGNKQDGDSGTKGVSTFGGATLFDDCIEGGGVVGFGGDRIINCNITIKDTDKTDHSGGIVFENSKSGINGFPTGATRCYNLDLTDDSNLIPTARLDPYDSITRLAPASEVKFPDKGFPDNSHNWYDWQMQFKSGEGGTQEGDGLVDSRWVLTIPSTAIPSSYKMKVGFSIYMEEAAFGDDGSGTNGNRDAYYRWNYTQSTDNYVREDVVGRAYTFMFSGLGITLSNSGNPSDGKRSRGGSMLWIEDIITLPNNTSDFKVFPRFSNKPEGNNGRAYFQFAYGGNRSDALLWSSPVPLQFTDITT